MALYYNDPAQPKWRTLQRDNTQRRRGVFWRRVGLLMVLIIAAGALIGAIEHNSLTRLFLADARIGKEAATPRSLTGPLDRRQLPDLLGSAPLINLDQPRFEIIHEGVPLTVETGLDIDLQRYLLANLNPAHALTIGIVAMDPATGRILAMVGHDKNAPSTNTCTTTLLPAASIIKIVTAAAALEGQGLNPGSTLTYTGNKYTLYHSQLRPKAPKNANKITLRDSFAQSINPVFGKLGALNLGKDKLSAQAQAFGFNRIIDFELGLSPSSLTVSEDPYELAEVASGLNRRTSLTPVHGAMIAAAVVNRGKMMAPWIIETITAPDGRILYRGDQRTLGQAMASASTSAMKDMMNETTVSGTCKKAFRDFRRDPALAKLAIGGKTGSINTEDGQARVDWFVGFAEQPGGSEKIALGIVVAHQDYIGVRANAYGMMAMRHYFQTLFAGGKNRLPAAAPRPAG